MNKPVFAARWRIFFFGLKHAYFAGRYQRKDPTRAEAHRYLLTQSEQALKELNR